VGGFGRLIFLGGVSEKSFWMVKMLHGCLDGVKNLFLGLEMSV
jgi:hypothetical protein